jgi:hypothetical protein
MSARSGRSTVTDTPLWNIFRGLNGSSVWWMALYVAGAVGSGIGGGVMLPRMLRSGETQEILLPDRPSRLALLSGLGLAGGAFLL